jgi:RNA polymerase sigma factor (sigma-70 family)
MLADNQSVARDHDLLTSALPMVEQSARKVRQRYGNRLSDDVLGVGTLALCEALPRFEDGPGRSLAQFAKRRVFGAMTNEVARLVEQARRDHDMVRLSYDEAHVSDAQDVLAEAEESVLAVEALQAVLQDLGDEDRLLLDLLFGDGLDQHQVGEVLGVAHETVCRRLGRLRTKLRRRLRGLGVTCAPPPTRLPGLHAVLRDHVTTPRAA